MHTATTKTQWVELRDDDNERLEDSEEWRKFRAAREAYRATLDGLVDRMNAESREYLEAYIDAEDLAVMEEICGRDEECLALYGYYEDAH